MPAKNYFFNILTFDFPGEPQTFYFNKEEKGFCHRLHWSQYPHEVEDIFPGIEAEGTEFIYTTFDYQKEGFTPLLIDLPNDNADLVKKYYNRKIFHFFKKIHEGYAKPYDKYWCAALSDYQILNNFARNNRRGLYNIVPVF